MGSSVIMYNGEYLRAKNKYGKKIYCPYVIFNQAQRVLKNNDFRRAQDAVDYARKIVERYRRIFG